MLSERLRKVFDDPQRKTWWVFQCDSPTDKNDTLFTPPTILGEPARAIEDQEIWAEEFPIDEVIWMLK
jgi:hypothetical protein